PGPARAWGGDPLRVHGARGGDRAERPHRRARPGRNRRRRRRRHRDATPGRNADDRRAEARRVTSRWRPFAFPLIPVWALCVALGIGAAFISLAGGNPWSAYWAVAYGAFGDVFGFGATLTKMAPILLAGLGVALAARVGLFNIGAEGQIYLGGLGAAWVGLYVSGLPALLPIPLALLAPPPPPPLSPLLPPH